MDIGDTLGVIFAAFLILVAISVAIWYFIFQKTTVTGEKTCTNDNDCLQSGSGLTPIQQYQGEICMNGICKNTSCSSNRECASKLPGTTCFGAGPTNGQAGCIPLTCRSTNDCNPPGTSEEDLKTGIKGISICVGGGDIGSVCVPAQTSDGKCFKVSGIMDEGGGKCSVCTPGGGQCPGGTYCANGRCLACGESQNDLCEDKTEDSSAIPAPYGFCKKGKNKCGGEFMCTDTVGGETLSTLPDGSTLDSENDVGICLPNGSQCAFTYYNSTASAIFDESARLPGQCKPDLPYCNVSGQCQSTPINAVCGRIAGVPTGGMTGTAGTPGSYDITGICSGRLVPVGSFGNLAQFNVQGTPQNATSTCNVGSDNPARNKIPSCMCDPRKTDDCPLGTFCQGISVGPTGTSATQGICTLAATGPTGSLGFFFPNSSCVVNTNNIPVCTPLTASAVVPGAAVQGGPGDFCYVKEQCIYRGKPQKNPLKALTCVNNQCVGTS